jgi:hypothetical protein
MVSFSFSLLKRNYVVVKKKGIMFPLEMKVPVQTPIHFQLAKIFRFSSPRVVSASDRG